MTANSLYELENLIKQKVNNALQTTVAEKSKKLMQDRVNKDVYDAYSPKSYDRTFKLRDDIKTEMIDNTLEIINDRKDGRDVVPVVELGKGYWNKALDEMIGARPFMSNTYNELKDGKAKEYLKDGLKNQGLDVI